MKHVVRDVVHRLRRATGPDLRHGRIASETPLSGAGGFDRGTPIDRYFIEQFLDEHSADIRGRVLEVGDDAYARRFGEGQITKQDVLSIESDCARATITGDLSLQDTLPAAAFDCAIVTQTLQYLIEPAVGLKHIRTSLRPGGVALITVPGVAPVSGDRWKDSYFWRFTLSSVARLMEKVFGPGNFECSALGNLYAATLFLHGAAVEEAEPEKLQGSMPEYAVVIAARGVAPNG